MSREDNEPSIILENTKVDEVPVTFKEYNEILNIQKAILEMLAQHQTYNIVLDQLCYLAEALLPNAVASIMLKNRETGLLSVLRAPSIPQAGHDALLNLKPGPKGGSCGNAVYHNEPQFVVDTYHDVRWEDIRQIAYDFNICSCWSMPVRNDKGEAIGTFALSSFEHRAPSIFHKMLLEISAHIVNIVLKNMKDEQRIKLLTQSMKNATEGMVISDKNNKILEVNNAFKKIYGYTESEILGKNPNVLSSGEHSIQFYQDMWNDIVKNNTWSGEIVNLKANGEKITQWMSISAISDNEDTYNYLAIFTDLTEIKKSQEKIKFLAFHDQLTGLPNKLKLEEILLGSSNCSLIQVDINNFNYINNAYGFEFGDKLLKKVAQIFQHNFEIKDVFRINSDEFILLLRENIVLSHKILELQRYFYHHSFNIDDIIINISFNYGAIQGCDSMLENMSLALKISKNFGKNRFHIFDEEKDHFDRKSQEKFVFANQLVYEAIKEDRIIPYFQGIRDNKKAIIDKYEVLVRIEKEDEIISPNIFLESAKLSGLLPNITKIIIDKSFEIMEHRTEVFSINITEDDLSKDYLLEYLDKKTKKYNISPQRVIFEILEGVSFSGKKNYITQLSMLKQKGFSLAIDDFGAEYSNFERVLDLEIDYLKIDAKYIKNIDTNKKSYEIVKAISSFAKNSSIKCIAEFVSHGSIQVVIEELGIDFSQGYYFSKPSKL